jgi:arginyl-tRNA synthetase
MGNIIEQTLKEIIWLALKDLGLDKCCLKEDIALEFAPAPGFGDISSNVCMKLAKSARKAPLAIANDLAQKALQVLEKSPFRKYVSQIKAEGAGFVNFYLSPVYFWEVLEQILEKKQDYARADLGKAEKVMIEFVSANPTGPLSVAHARQAAVGDALANIMSYLGFDVQKEYYLNDEGNQINILGESVKLRLEQLKGQDVVFPENCYQGDYIVEMARLVQDKGLKIDDFSEYASGVILDIIRQELNDFHVEFGCWFSQKELRKSGKIQVALDYLKEKGFVYEEGGALWFKSTQFGDDKDRVVIKSDGSYTYLAPDIAYHQDKYRRGFKRLINLWGPDHHGYISRLKASVAALGQDPETLSVVIVQLASIFREGKPIEMSTRRGQYITLREVLEEVGVDASRFFFMMRRTSSHLNFDLETAKKQTPENPVYYIQYAYARISSILRQAGYDGKIDILDLSLLKESEEIDLARKLWQFSFILNVCLKTLDPYMLTVYLQETAETFHKFYDRHRVLGQEDKLTRARLGLISATRITLATCLGLLGVSAPEQM